MLLKVTQQCHFSTNQRNRKLLTPTDKRQTDNKHSVRLCSTNHAWKNIHKLWATKICLRYVQRWDLFVSFTWVTYSLSSITQIHILYTFAIDIARWDSSLFCQSLLIPLFKNGPFGLHIVAASESNKVHVMYFEDRHSSALPYIICLVPPPTSLNT